MMIKFAIFLFLVISQAKSDEEQVDLIEWNNNWALQCDIPGNDLFQAHTTGSTCGGKCERTVGCTHFVWTDHKGGTCWLKKGAVSKKNAVPKYVDASVCGLIYPIKTTNNIQWFGYWALNCDFPGNELLKVNTTSESLCSAECGLIEECSHFVWRPFEVSESGLGGVCLLKKGYVSREDAVEKHNPNAANSFCGIV